MSTVSVISPKKLIEVALPLDAINAASVREGYIYKGNPSSLHKWWAQRPMAAARAVLFAQLVNDPEDAWRCLNPDREPSPQIRGHWTKARTRLFRLIEDIVRWEAACDVRLLEQARDAIRASWAETCQLNAAHPDAKTLFDPSVLPPVHDPFAGGGTIPLEAQRLGLVTYASDLNPVAVTLNRSMLDVPHRFNGQGPVFPGAAGERATWLGPSGIAEDVRRYALLIVKRAAMELQEQYPSVEITEHLARDRTDLSPLVGSRVKPIAWLWARTVRSPSPAHAHIQVPLAATFAVSTKAGSEFHVEPLVSAHDYRFVVKAGPPPEKWRNGTKAGRATFRCILSNAPISRDYIAAEAADGRMGKRLMAVVVQTSIGRLYVSPTTDQEITHSFDFEDTASDIEFFEGALGFRVSAYGMRRWRDLFTERQRATLSCFARVVGNCRAQIETEAVAAGMPADGRRLEEGGRGAKAYSEAILTYLAYGVSKIAMYNNALVPWYSKENRPSMLFTQQVLSMTWDFAELNPLADLGGAAGKSFEIVADAIEGLATDDRPTIVKQISATDEWLKPGYVVSTDPPYYDNIGYADLSDFFYVWLRPMLRGTYPETFATRATPKDDELVATPGRKGSQEEAERFFLDGMSRVLHRLARGHHPAFPLTLYYAFKQSETSDGSTTSTGWETFLEAIVRSGLAIVGTWPIRTERAGRQRDTGSNALASSVVIVCRPRNAGAGSVSRRQFVRMLNEALPLSLDAMTRESEGQHSPVAPVDLSQAIIGPGMAIFSRYEAVLEADGTPMTVKTALQLINRFLAEDDFDADTQFCLHWFDQHGWETGKFGEADTLARAKGTSVDGVKQSGVVEAGGGNVRLLRWKDYPADWDARSDSRLPVWEALHQLIRAYQNEGDSGASKVLAAVASKAETSRQLAYRLYTLCERKGWADDARAYNEVVTGWSSIETAAAKIPGPSQGILFDFTKEKP